MQDLDKFKNEMNLSGKNVYVGNRYAPVLDDTGWDNTKEYEPLTIIQYQGDSYISRTYVPTGIDILNKDYWYSIGVYNAQIASYRQRVEEVEKQFSGVQSGVTTNASDIVELDNDLQLLENKFNQTVKIVTPEMTLPEIQTVLNLGGDIKFASGEYKFDLPNDSVNTVLKVVSDSTIFFDKQAKISLNAHQSTHYRILDIYNVKNVDIINANIDGSKVLNTQTDGEWGMGISIRGSENIRILNAEISNCWGDGIYIGSTPEMNYCKNVTLENVTCDGNRRQGISVISVKGLYGDNVYLLNTKGTAPEAGIDFEPNYNTEFLQDIHFKGLKTENNNGSGMLIMLQAFQGNHEKVNATFEQFNSFNDNGHGIAFRLFTGKANGNWVFNNPYIKNSGLAAITIINMEKTFSKIVLNKPVIVNSNLKAVGGTTTGSSIAVYRSKDFESENTEFKTGNIIIDTPKISLETGYTKTGASISFIDALTSVKYIEDVILNDVDMLDVNNGSLLPSGRIQLLDDNKLKYWSGASPVTNAYPTVDKMYNVIEFEGTKNCIAKLKSLNTDHVLPLRFELNDVSTNWFRVTPPDGEEIRPYEFRNGLELSNGNNVGSSVTLKRINNYWQVINIIGNWTGIE